MKIDLLTVPWDSGHRAVRMGAGPLQFMKGGVAARLEALGHDVQHRPIDREDGIWSDAASAFELNRCIARTIVASRADNRFPLVLSGNCNSAVGVLAALPDAPQTAVAWFDAHGDLNTPETTTSGFFDGMALSIAVGDAWRGMAATIEGFQPVDPRNILLIGARDLDDAERARIVDLKVNHLPPAELKRLPKAIASVRSRSRGMLLHVDLDVLDRSEAPANHFASGGGLTAAELFDAVDALADAIPIEAAVIASWDPSLDDQQRMFAIGMQLIERIVALAARS